MEIFGFKSFADRSRIEFTPGITALLGPNGCGKSNVVDALKWVLGEQASRSLRADKMEDLIFNGTESRKALAVAEVSLTLSNETRVLDLDVAEICVKRRLYRSGESEYFINETPVKLKEVRELFYDTGVGKSAYSVMEQGRIDQILSTKPEERRYLFEEAAGITKTRMRGQEAERKLEKTEENLRQLEGILAEIRRTRESLQKQAEKTKAYRALRQEVFELEKRQQLRKIKELTTSRSVWAQKLEEKQAQRSDTQNGLEELNRTLEAGLKEVSGWEEQLVAGQKQLYGLDLEKSSIQNQVKVQQERRSHHENQLALTESRAKTFAERLSALQAETQEKLAQKHQRDQELAACQDNITLFERNIETAKLELVALAQQIQDAEQTLTNETQTERQLLNELGAVTDRLVHELEVGLQTAPDSAQMSSWAHLVDQGLANALLQTKGRAALLTDVLSVRSWPDDAPWAFLEKVAQNWQELATLLSDVQEHWVRYRASVPSFLQEFLAPEGIVTQKRSLEGKINASRQRATAAQDEIVTRRAQATRLTAQVEEYRQSLEELKIRQGTMNAQAQAGETALAELYQRVQEQEWSRQENERDQEEHRERIRLIDTNLEGLKAQEAELARQDNVLRGDTDKLEASIREKNQQMLGLEQGIKQKMNQLADFQREVERFQVHKAQLDTEIQAVLDHFRDKHSVDLAESLATLDSLDNADEKDLWNDKKEALKALGQVNLMAVEEFAEVDERYRFLTSQSEDLKKAREDLNQVTKEIRRESVLLFEKTFREIQTQFHQVFRRLFGGGRAELRLSDPANPLESGIDLFCQPPGKKLESISLLSGGEKSMTAVALLFATFQVKPSPFCLLDEIDAALDEANVDRFVNMLFEFAKTSQFIVISHNKKTAAGASTMIGVTMEDPGISKIIALRLSTGDSQGDQS